MSVTVLLFGCWLCWPAYCPVLLFSWSPASQAIAIRVFAACSSPLLLLLLSRRRWFQKCPHLCFAFSSRLILCTTNHEHMLCSNIYENFLNFKAGVPLSLQSMLVLNVDGGCRATWKALGFSMECTLVHVAGPGSTWELLLSSLIGADNKNMQYSVAHKLRLL